MMWIALVLCITLPIEVYTIVVSLIPQIIIINLAMRDLKIFAINSILIEISSHILILSARF